MQTENEVPNNQIKFNSNNDLSGIQMSLYSFKVFSHTFRFKIKLHKYTEI